MYIWQNVYFINWYNLTSPVHQWVPLHPSTVPVFYVWKNLWRHVGKGTIFEHDNNYVDTCGSNITISLSSPSRISHMGAGGWRDDNLLFEQFPPPKLYGNDWGGGRVRCILCVRTNVHPYFMVKWKLSFLLYNISNITFSTGIIVVQLFWNSHHSFIVPVFTLLMLTD